MMRTRRAMLFGVALALGVGAGCLTRSLPIPPPSAAVQSVTECPALDCPMGGVIVTVGGNDARAGSTVIVQVGDPFGPTNEYLGGSARASDAGVWQVTATPRQVSPGRVAAPQRGDTIRVFLVTEDGEASQSFYTQVPRR